MRHRVYGKHLNRDTNQRTALFRSLVRELFLHESIQTTEPKAKAIKGLVDTMISKSKKADEASKRIVNAFLVHPTIVKKVMEEIAPRYTDRVSGFTTSVRLGTRAGDGAMLVQMSLIKEIVSKDGEVKKIKASKVEVVGKEEEAAALEVKEEKKETKKQRASKKETK